MYLVHYSDSEFFLVAVRLGEEETAWALQCARAARPLFQQEPKPSVVVYEWHQSVGLIFPDYQPIACVGYVHIRGYLDETLLFTDGESLWWFGTDSDGCARRSIAMPVRVIERIANGEITLPCEGIE